MNPLYALRLLAPGHYSMAKFSMPDFNVEATYNLTAKGAGYSCDCPASHRTVKTKPCKHQRMLRIMEGAVNTDRFYDPVTGHWHMPLPPELSQAAFNGVPPKADSPEGVGSESQPPEITAAKVQHYNAQTQADRPIITRRI